MVTVVRLKIGETITLFKSLKAGDIQIVNKLPGCVKLIAAVEPAQYKGPVEQQRP